MTAVLPVRRIEGKELTEHEWLACDWPFDMLQYLDGKIEDQAFMRFSVACCRRIWPLIPDHRSQAVVEATEKYLRCDMTAEEAGQICAKWQGAHEDGKVEDLAGGITREAIESVNGLGFGHAAQVAKACYESAGYAASEALRVGTAKQTDIERKWKAAEHAERLAQCQLLRDLFEYPRPSSLEIA